jgi:F-type H+-transporting ATPase subunit a
MTLDIDIAPSVLFNLGQLSVTTTFILQVFMTLLLAGVFIFTAQHWRLIPSKGQLLIEGIISLALSQVNKITQNEVKTKKIFPLVFTFFIFIASSNLITLLPGLGAITIHDIGGQQTAFFRSILADYSMVLVMTLITVILCQIIFIIYNGWFKYFSKWFNFSSPLAFILGLMDIVGEFAKILSLSFRLFGNVFAGEVLLLVVTALAPYVIPFPFFALTLFSSVIQAYVFAILSAVFISYNMEVVDAK